MIKIVLYDAGSGDCLHIRYCGACGVYRNILVDSGTIRFGRKFAELCAEIEKSGEKIDLMIITHIDDDHLGGLLYMVRQDIAVHADTVILNHPEEVSTLSAYGDTPLSLRHNDTIFRSLSAPAQNLILCGACRDEKIPLDGAMLHILHPTSKKKNQVFGSVLGDTSLGAADDRSVPLQILADKKLPPADASNSNGASIVFVLEYAEKRLLFTGDAWADDILDGIRSWSAQEQLEMPVCFDAIKLPHHGSARNISTEWPQVIWAQQYLLCADGKVHPDKLTIAKLLKWYGSADIFSAHAWWDNQYFSETDINEFITPGKLVLRSGKGGIGIWQT